MRTRRSQESTILLVTVLNVCVHAAIAAAQIDFAEPQFYADPGAFRIAAGDLNGDGAIDIVVASCCPNDQVRILFNSGDGALSAPVVVSTVTPTAICTGDLDDDGDLEIIIGDYWLGSVRILLNNGNGTFTFESSWPVGVEPLSIAVGDMNGDRDPDLVVTSAGFYGEPGDVTVLFNDGGAIFSESQTYSTMGLFPAFVSIGDIDSDADLDVVVSNSDSWALFQNNGDGTLSEPVLTPSDAPRQCLLNDYDGDGDVDLAVRRGDVADIFLNDGSGMFGEPVSYALGSGQDVMEAGDLDGDGDLDLLAANNPDDDVSILLNNGDGTFADEIGLFVGNGPQDAVIADLNSDGALDFAVCNGAGDNVAILLNERGLAQCPGDTNASGVVDVLDLVAVIVDWGTDGSGNSGDINGSGIVDVGDLIAVINGWGPCPEATAACCLPDGSCNELSEDGCSTAGGTPSPGEVCGSPQACCLGDSTCELLDPLCCGASAVCRRGRARRVSRIPVCRLPRTTSAPMPPRSRSEPRSS